MYFNFHILPDFNRKPIASQFLNFKNESKDASMVEECSTHIILDGCQDIPECFNIRWRIS